MEFENLGYSLEYYANGKYIGSVRMSDEDWSSFPLGYASRKHKTAIEPIKVKNGMGKIKTIKKGTEYYTEIIQLCGKLSASHSEKIELFRKSKAWKNGI